jgi:hypothetical protein
MTSIDIRNMDQPKIDAIIFATNENFDYPSVATRIFKRVDHRPKNEGKSYNRIGGECWQPKYEIPIVNKEHAENLIKALQYAIKEGWFDEC